MRTRLAALAVILAGTTACKSPSPTATAESSSQPAPPQAETQWPGPQPDGSMLLPNMWSLHPAGRQVLLGDFPVNIAVHPSGKWAAILHSGYGRHEVITVRIADDSVISRAPINESFYGLAFTRDGKTLYC